jgi:hypothetical protein
MSLWYVWCKPCTYLASRLALSLKEPNQASTWASSPRRTIRCDQNNFLILWYVRRKPCTYLASRLALYQMNWVKHPLELRHLRLLSGASKTISEPMVCLAQTCTCLEPTPALSLNGPKRDSTWPTSPWSSIGCVQNDFLRLCYVRHKSCTYLASRLALSSNGLNWPST